MTSRAATPTIGSLFSGYGGLDAGVTQALGDATVAWHCDYDTGPSKVLAHHWPNVPNLHDVTAVDWAAVEPVDVITGGSPCQDVSHAGKRAGMRAGTRSGLWASMCDAIDIIRPSLVVWENVRGSLSAPADSSVEPCPICVGDDGDVHLRALGRVLGDLAELGYDASWVGVRASDAGAPHARFRVFVAAWPAGPEHAYRGGRQTGGGLGEGEGPTWGHNPRGAGSAVAVPADDGRERGRGARDGWPGPADGDLAPADAIGGGLQRRGGPGAVGGAPATGEGDRGEREWDGDAPGRGCAAASDAVGGGCDGRARDAQRGEERGAAAAGGGREPEPVAWGDYAPAVGRWEDVTGRRAPAPTEPGRTGNPRLSPRFVEWLMGLPDGHVTAVPGLTRNEQLKLLGNGVVPQQAALAVRALLPDLPVHVRARLGLT